MNARERFVKTMHFKPVDRIPLFTEGYWYETIKRWHEEGLPRELYAEEYIGFGRGADLTGIERIEKFFGFDRWENMDIYQGMLPPFDEQIIEENKRFRIVIDKDGIKKKEFKELAETSMPQWLDFPVKTRKDFKELTKRYNPSSLGRYPVWWKDHVRCWMKREHPLYIGYYPTIGGFFSAIRDWMGFERALITFHDDPIFVHEMMDFITNFIIETEEKAVKEVDIDFALFYEDMAYKTAPMISPKMFQKFILPCYKKISSFLRKHGTDIIIVDSDGNLNELIPLLLEAGINGILPLEVAAGMNPVALRKEYAHDLVMVGGIDKRALSKDKKSIEKEVMAKVPYLIKEGGYLPDIDHIVPPNVPFKNYVYYVKLIKNISEKGCYF